MDQVVLVEFAEGLRAISPSHDIFEMPILINILHVIFAGPHACLNLPDIVLDGESRIDKLLLEEIGLHHVWELSMTEVLSVCRLNLV